MTTTPTTIAKDQAGTVTEMCYGKELWDNFTILEETTRTRSQRLYFVKDFLWSFRSILDTF